MNENLFINKREYEQELVQRWGWLTEDIEDSESRLNTNLMLESSYKMMVQQKSVPAGWLEENILKEGSGVLTEAPQYSTGIGDYVIPKVMFPIIRRVMPELIANKLVAVQPIQAPTGVIYYITYQYSNSKGEVAAGDEFSANPYTYGTSSKIKKNGFPGYATFYTSEKVGPFVKTITSTGDQEITDATSGKKIIDFLGTDATAYKVKRYEVYNQTTGLGVPVEASDITFDAATGAVTLAGALVEDHTVTQQDPTKPINERTVPFAVGDTIRFFLVYNQEGTDKIPEMEFFIDYQTVNTTERKLKVRWTKEAEQDMQAYHKIDVEAELVKVAAIQTNYEIDRELMRFIDDTIIPELSFTHDWTNDAATTGNNTTGNYLDRHRALAQKLYFASTQVAAYNHLGPADWAVVSPQVAALLMMLPDWKSGEISANKTTFYGAGFLGNGSLTVYVDPNRTGPQANEITMGRKPNDSTYGASVVYSPYANWMSSTITHPSTFDSIRGFFSRYALTRVVRSSFNFSRVSIANYYDRFNA
jgi:hypothetical protein